MMKKYICGFFCVLFLCMSFVFRISAKDEEDLLLYANAAVLMDAESGRILYAKNCNEKLPMASTTKIMTCILTLEADCTEEEVSVSSYAASMPAVHLGVKKGEIYVIRDLLYSLMLESHNDSAVVIAEYLGTKMLNHKAGDTVLNSDCSTHSREESEKAVSVFAEAMNDKAKEIGCTDTCFLTPNGLDKEIEKNVNGRMIKKIHSTTAADLARIMAYCISGSSAKDSFLNITATDAYTFHNKKRTFTLQNHNSFLHMMEGAQSGKTGFTANAGYCYVGSLKREDRTFVVALLGCGWPNHKTWKWKDTGKLMRYGLDHYVYRCLTDREILFPEEKLPKIIVENGIPEDFCEEASISLAVEDRSKQERQGILMRPEEEITVEIIRPDVISAPVQRGETVGEIRYLVDGEIYRTERIVARQTVLLIDFKWCLGRIIQLFMI